MKNKVLLLAASLVCLLPLSSFKTYHKAEVQKVNQKFTDVEFGDFQTSDGIVYSVWGHGSLITRVEYLFGDPTNSIAAGSTVSSTALSGATYHPVTNTCSGLTIYPINRSAFTLPSDYKLEFY